jgi:hypothetical protein
MMIAHVRNFLIGLAVITGCVASAMMLGSPAAGTADPGLEVSAEAVELAKNPFFKGQITPQQAEKLIQAAMQITQFGDVNIPYPMNCLPFYVGMTFNDLGDFCLFPNSAGIHFPYKLLPGEKLTPEQEHVKQEGERLRAESVERRFPERWKNTVYLGQLTMLWLPKQYIPGDDEYNHKLAAQFILLAIEHGNYKPQPN